MLKYQKVAAYTHPWNKKIEKIQKEDTVFLYQNGKGIIAMGSAKGEVERLPEHGFPEEYSMPLTNFLVFEDRAITPGEIKVQTDNSLSYRQTLSNIEPLIGEKLKAYVQKTRVLATP